MSGPTHPTQPTQQPPAWQQPPQWGQAPPPTPPRKRPAWYARPLFWIVTMIGLVGLLVAAFIAVPSEETPTRTAKATTAPQATTPPATTPPASDPDVAEPPQAGPQTMSVGETISIQQSADTSGFADPAEGGADITVTKVEAAIREPIDYGSKPERGWFVVVHVKAVGTGGGLDVNPFDFYVKSPNGFKTEDSTFADYWGPVLESATLNDGEHVSGTMVFDVPSRHGQIVYAPNLDGEPVGIWKF
jgi:Domain of unknown function (DUF4352)